MIHGLGIVFVLGTVLVVMSGCAHFRRSTGALQEMEKAGVNEQLPVVHLDTRREIEREISAVRAEKVLVPTEVLRSLVKAEKSLEAQCSDLGQQLKAIKDVDLQTTETEKDL